MKAPSKSPGSNGHPADDCPRDLAELPTQVTIRTGSRLHFGFFSVRRQQDVRRFGGLGVMLESPGVELVVSRIDAATDTHNGPCRAVARVKNFAEAYRQSTGSTDRASFCIRSAIPEHKGLGSGTQLGLAVGRALSQFIGAEEPIDQTARNISRGRRSAIGVHGFESGGLIVDGGKSGCELGTLMSRIEFPEEWRFLLAWPRTVEGLSGSSERHAFQDLSEMSAEVTKRLEHLAVEEVLPAVHQRDFSRCAAGLHEFGMLNGEYFAPIQHGVYANQRMAELAASIRRSGFAGVGQSSWGPAIWILCECEASAQSLSERLQLDERWTDCEFRIASPKNRPATIHVETAAAHSMPSPDYS